MATVPHTPDQSKNPFIVAALEYLRRGYSIIPVNGKKAAIKWKPYQTRLPTEAELREWFSRPDVTGIAVIAGPVSGGLAVRDFDTVSTYEVWAAQYPLLAKTLPTVKSPRGYHVWCRSDWPHIVRMKPGEFRGIGITLCPPSLHTNGGGYEWIIPLPAGELPFVTHEVFVGKTVAETAEISEAIGSDSSAISDFSATDPDALIRSCLPQKPGERNDCLLKLARGAKFNLNMANAPNSELKMLVRQWHQLALPVITTKELDASWAEFLHAFREAKFPLGFDLVDEVARFVDPENLPAVADNYDSMAVKILIGLCYELAKRNRGRFFLSTHDAAPRVGLSPGLVWKRMKMLEADGVIECLERGNEYRASRYRWIGA